MDRTLFQHNHLRVKRCRHGVMAFNVNDLFIGRSLDLYGEWCEAELHTLGQMLAPGQVVLDVGANIGTHTLFFAQRVAPEGKVYAFEPQRLAFQLLCGNLALNTLTNVIAQQVAVGEQTGTTRIASRDPRRPDNFGAISVDAAAPGEEVAIIRIDDLELSRCDLIKIDVEGTERQVLLGALRTLERCRPVLFLENNRDAATSWALIETLTAAGYQACWHLAPYFNPRNFAGHAENVFGGLMPEANLLCFHREASVQTAGFEPVAGVDDSWQQAVERIRSKSRTSISTATRLEPSVPVSVCVIARNEAHNLPACLTGLRDWVQELIVVDTGSTDDTRAVAEQLGARVIDFTWCDDFAAARNASLAAARGRWIFWLDADDRLAAAQQAKLRQLCQQLPDRNLALLATCRSVSLSGTAELADHVRLFRNDAAIRWKYRIHEQILPAIRRAGGELVRSDLVIEHTGYAADADLQRRKMERNLRLLQLQLADTPHDPFMLFCFARTLQALEQPVEACQAATAALQGYAEHDPQRLLPLVLLSSLRRAAGRNAAAAAMCEDGLRHFPHDAELLYEASQAFRAAGDRKRSAVCLETLLQIPSAGRLTSLPQGVRGPLAKHNLGVLALEQGDAATAERWFLATLDNDPRSVATWQGLELLWHQQRRFVERDQARRQLDQLQAPPVRPPATINRP